MGFAGLLPVCHASSDETVAFSEDSSLSGAGPLLSSFRQLGVGERSKVLSESLAS